MDQPSYREIDIDLLPELETEIGMSGAMTQVEVGGQICLEVGVLVATIIR